ncbi:MAG TPA: DUF4112 domain-containing protein [Gemmatimonadales bacterium]|nr:DUF4112 domain-containing protein [Gemmatimonadales bacterium]
MSYPLRPATEPVVRTHPVPRIERLRAVSRLLDSAFVIPGTGFRFGLDALIGLVPGVGDAIGALFSGYIILQASRLGAPRSVLTRMIANVGIDTVVGLIPLLGDLFDAGWKANNRNLALLEQHVHQPAVARAGSRRALVGFGAAFIAFLVALVAAGFLLGQLVMNLLQR